MRVVVDTNIWVSGLILPDGPPGRVLDAVRRGALVPVATWELAHEIVEVLGRPRLKVYGLTEADARDVATLLAPFLPSIEVDVPTRDPGDVAAVAAAVAGGVEAIVTGDRDLLDHASLRAWLAEHAVEVVTAVEVLQWLGDV